MYTRTRGSGLRAPRAAHMAAHRPAASPRRAPRLRPAVHSRLRDGFESRAGQLTAAGATSPRSLLCRVSRFPSRGSSVCVCVAERFHCRSSGSLCGEFAVACDPQLQSAALVAEQQIGPAQVADADE